MTNIVSRFIQHLADLPNREADRKKKQGVEFNAKPVYTSAKDATGKDLPIPAAFTLFQWKLFDILSGSLNTAIVYENKIDNRTYRITTVPYHLGMALSSLGALPALAIRVTYSALMILVRYAMSKSIVEATDPFFRNSANLIRALGMIIRGTVSSVFNLSVAIFTDPYRWWNLPTGPKKKCLIVVDAQNTFFEGGNLGVAASNGIKPNLIRIIKAAKEAGVLIIFTQDWHPADHISFAANNKTKLYAQRHIWGLKNPQMMWPSHGIQGTKEAEFFPENPLKKGEYIVVKKGVNRDIDSYSGFNDNEGLDETQLKAILDAHNIGDVMTCGLAVDYCVGDTTLDAQRLGFQTTFIKDASEGVAAETILKKMEEMYQKGTIFANTDQLIDGEGKLKFITRNESVPYNFSK